MYIITGQTATGKTKLALEMADTHNGELVNADSRQIYRRLDIVTGKDYPPAANNPASHASRLAGVAGRQELATKIWLYDIADPKEHFSSFDYVQKAEAAITDIKSRGKTPIVVGGTWLYIKHLIYGFDYSGKPDWELRDRLSDKSVPELQAILEEKMPGSLAAMNHSDRNNPRRLIRRIEFHHTSEVDTSEVNTSEVFKFRQGMIKIIGLRFGDKAKLIAAIKKRVDDRIRQGAIEETRKILNAGYNENDPGLKTLGYRQIIPFLKGEIGREEMVKLWITAETQYAKRQMTFMKKDPNIIWKNVDAV